MADPFALVVWLPVAFGVLVAASYVGTTLALRAYFDDDAFSVTDLVSVDDPEEG